MLKHGPLRRDIDRVLEFRKTIKLSGHKWTAIDHRRVYSASLYEVTSEHVSSVCLLLLFSRTSSAAALLRSCVESAVRGTWLLLVATENDIENVVAERGKDKGWPGLDQMMGAIEGHHKAGGPLRRIFTHTGALNDLTHGGLMQIAHRMGPHAGQDTVPHVNRMCLRNVCNALALITCSLHLDVNDLSEVASVTLRAAELFASFEMAGDAQAPMR
ncbi:DUF6988 family protein [Paracidobacterium acidisoli]|uniref:DUF6988 family protein n=1 Tax=Paracidobacterium acidisoli TaxID=2303751 RepID=UPI0011C19648|nr:hypothetical protein [Paracidobacterium acidisoli]MBT9333357.1 hypothetical protein [Paracidobacterium acidisoli]